MRTGLKASALIAVLALAGCGGNSGDQQAVGSEDSGDKSPLAEYMGEGFSREGGRGFTRVVRAGGGNEPTEEQLAKQRKVEEATATCMKNAGFDYVPVPPESNPKSKFNDAFNLPPDKFAEQYGYGISTIDWSMPADASDPNQKIRGALSPRAQQAYDKALNGPHATGNGRVIAAPGGKDESKLDLGCRGKAAEEVYGKRDRKVDDFRKWESLFKDLGQLDKRIQADQRVVDATAKWADCLADAGHAGYEKVEEPREKVQQKLNELTGNNPPAKGAGPAGGDGAPSLDKVDAAKLTELRKFEIELAKADQGCKTKVYDEPYKQARDEHEKQFVEQNKATLEAYRDEMAQR